MSTANQSQLFLWPRKCVARVVQCNSVELGNQKPSLAAIFWWLKETLFLRRSADRHMKETIVQIIDQFLSWENETHQRSFVVPGAVLVFSSVDRLTGWWLRFGRYWGDAFRLRRQEGSLRYCTSLGWKMCGDRVFFFVEARRGLKLGGGFEYFLFSPLLGEDSHFD